jgi:hypothetical protein
VLTVDRPIKSFSDAILRLLEIALSIQDHATRKLRQLRTAGLDEHTLAEYAATMQRTLDVDGRAALEDSKLPGPTNGYPFLVSAELKAKQKQDPLVSPAT